MRRYPSSALRRFAQPLGALTRLAIAGACQLLASDAVAAGVPLPAFDARGVPVIAGKPVVELDGPVGHVRIDYADGALGYLVLTSEEAGHRTFAVRSVDFNGRRGPEVGTVVVDAASGMRQFRSTANPGQRIAFSGMVPCPGTIILTRGSLVVRIAADGVAVPQTLADGWEALPGDPRSGDVCGTGLVVVHRLRRASPFQSLVPVLERYDYGVARVADGRTFAVPVTPDLHGAPDDPLGHQIDYRRIDRHVLVAFIGPRTQHAQLLDVDTGKQAVVFERALGLASLRFEDAPGQPTALGVDYGFGRKRQDDVARWLAAQP